MKKYKDIDKVYQIHLLLNAAMYLFEDLDEDNFFIKDEEELYQHLVRVSENISSHLESHQINNYSYILDRISKLVIRLKVNKL